jgi:AcrR family transcriptional regulator
MGYRHSETEILEAATSVALEAGMAGLTFSAVGARLGISDRTVVYYFPSKPDLVLAVAGALGAQLMAVLEEAFGDERMDSPEMLRRGWPVLTTPAADRIFALYFEIVGLAAAGVVPYGVLARSMVEGWVEWLVPRSKGRTLADRRRQALATTAQVDGLLLLRQVLGAAAADEAVGKIR